MNRYIALIFLIISCSASAEDFQKCVYTPKATEKDSSMMSKIFQDCASYKNGVLNIAKAHLASLNFNKDNMADFYTAGKYFYVKPDGQFLAVLFYDNGPDYYKEGLVRALHNGKIAYYNMDFKLVLAPAYDRAWPFREGRALVCKGCALVESADSEHRSVEGGVWGYINKAGKEVVPVKYTSPEAARK